MNLETLARQLVDADEANEHYQQAADKAAERFKAAQIAFWTAMHDAKQTEATLELGEGYGNVKFQKQETILGSVLKGREVEAYEAFKREGIADQVFDEDRPVLRKRVLNQIVNSRLASGQPLPVGVNFSSRKYVTITKKG